MDGGQDGVSRPAGGVTADGLGGGPGAPLARHLQRLEQELRAVLETVHACRQILDAPREAEPAERAVPAASSASTAACGRVTSFAASAPLLAAPFSSSALSSPTLFSPLSSLLASPAAANDRGACATSASDFLSSASAASGSGGAGGVLPRIDGALGETGWSLLRDGWVLVAPDGFRLRLNLCERAILSAMVCAPQHALSLGGLIELLTQTRANFGQKPLATSSMRMILMRLMKKLERSGAPCPILSVHGWGYRLRVGDEPAGGRGQMVQGGRMAATAAAGVAGMPMAAALTPSPGSIALTPASSFGEPMTPSTPSSIPPSFADAFAVPASAAAAAGAAAASRTPVQPISPKSVLAARRGASPVRADAADRASGALGG